MLDNAEIRRAFPHLAQNVYLNTASAGLSWVGQGDAAAEFYRHKMGGITQHDDWINRAEDTRNLLGKLLGVPAGRIWFTGSTTEALNLIALAMPLAPGDSVALAEDEFASVVAPWMTLQRSGVRLNRIPVKNESDRTSALCAAVNASTRVLAVSHVHWRTGTRVDLDALSTVCDKYECRLIVDGVQAAGAVAVDAGCSDAYCASVFKWLLSGFGLGFMVLSDRLSAELTPALRGYSNVPPSRSLRYGHQNYPGIYALHATLQYLETLGWSEIYSQVDRLTARLSVSLRERGFDLVTPHDARAGIISIRHPAVAQLVAALAAESISVEDGTPFLRVSPHFYNTDEDVDRFIRVLTRDS
jgi:selenocysteine lyase/cysteine desulfurase